MEQMMTTPIAKTLLRSLLIAFIVASCSMQKAATSSQPSKGQLAQQNVDATIWYNTSAENFYIYHQTYAYAKTQLVERLKINTTGAPPSVILDIDETVLDNSPYMFELIARGEAFSDISWDKWVQQASAKLLPGVQDFLMFCEQNGVQVYYISNRSEEQLDFTMQNLVKYNLPNVNPENILLKKDMSDKTERRRLVQQQTNVVLYIGDNLRDFDEMFRDRSDKFGKVIVERQLQDMLPQFILLPNPMYGQWQAIFSFPEGASDAEKASLKIDQAQPRDYE
jgi:5'-nucleotidase (lipoprotein e(P4) family)